MTPYLFSVLFLLSIDSMQVVNGVAGKSVADSPAPAVKMSSYVVSFDELPDGFMKLKVSRKNPAMKPVVADTLLETVFLKVNRIDRRHIPWGREALVPVDREKAIRFSPVPTCLADTRGDREIRVFLDRQYFGAYEKGALLFWGPISSGRQKHRTPSGRYQVQYKQRFRRSLKYENAPMPYSINYNEGFFLHEQSLPGYPASHGCVRLLKNDAQRLFTWSRVNDPITVVSVRDSVSVKSCQERKTGASDSLKSQKGISQTRPSVRLPDASGNRFVSGSNAGVTISKVSGN